MASLREVGQRLKLAREAQGLTLDDVAARTRITIRHLLALEEGNETDLPETFYIRGFLKKYAEAVGLAPNDVADAYKAAPVPASPQAEFRPSFFGPAVYYLAIIGLLGGAAALAWHFQPRVSVVDGSPSPSPTVAPSPTPSPAPTATPSPAPTATATAAPSPGPTQTSVSVQPDPSGQPSAAVAIVPSAMASVAASAAPPLPSRPPSAMPSKPPAAKPTKPPSAKPSKAPKPSPKPKPSATLKPAATAKPSATAKPAATPMPTPSAEPTTPPSIEPTLAPAGVPASAAVTATPKPAPSAKPSPAKPSGAKTQVQLSFVERSWVEVRVDGRLVFEGILGKGASKKFSGKAIEIAAGNSGGVRITKDGKDLGRMGRHAEVGVRSYKP